MWTLIIFAFITLASSRNVEYDHNGEIDEVLNDMFGLRNGVKQHSDENNSGDFSRQSKIVDSYQNYRRVGETGEPFTNQHVHWHHHGHHHNHQRNNEHVNNNNGHDSDKNIPTVTVGNSDMNTQRSSVNRNTENNTQRIKTNTNNKTDSNISKTNPTDSHYARSNPVTESVPYNTTTSEKGVKNNTKLIDNSTAKNINLNTTAKGVTNKNLSMDEDRWIWENGSTLKPNTTTQAPTTEVGVGHRAAFSGDGCATGKVKIGNVCVDED